MVKEITNAAKLAIVKTMFAPAIVVSEEAFVNITVNPGCYKKNLTFVSLAIWSKVWSRGSWFRIPAHQIKDENGVKAMQGSCTPSLLVQEKKIFR